MPDPVRPAVRIRCFGPFAAEINGQPLPVLHSKKEKLLLAYLAVRYGREVQRGRNRKRAVARFVGGAGAVQSASDVEQSA